MNRSTPVAIALGSNLGDRDAHLDFAVSRLSTLLSNIRVSSRHDTAPVDVVGSQPRYLNAAVAGDTTLDPHDLLRALRQIEDERGRERPYINAPRTLDVDLILYGEYGAVRCGIDRSAPAIPRASIRARSARRDRAGDD
ncbi:MAG: 2-amino-4-hydroxy-6-hydroxymethyldihydropteridine diphosphokinase [Vicinamibacterales bacterium]